MAREAAPATLPKWARVVGYGLAAATCLYACWVAMAFLGTKYEDTTATRRSSGLWREHLNIPSEATLVRSQKFHRMVEEGERFEFRLPEARTPEAWMAQMVKGRPLEEYKFSELRYDAGEGPAAELNKRRIEDDFELTYDPGSKLYRFQVAYD